MDSAGLHFELLQNLHTGVVVHLPDTRIVFCNQRAAELLGLSVDQMMGKTAMDPNWRFVAENGAPLMPSQYPVSLVIANLEPFDELVLGVQSALKDEVTWLLVSAYPDFYADGSLKQVVVNFYSIAKRKLLEEQLVTSAAELADLYNQAPCGYCSLDANNKFLHINATLLGWLGATRDDLVGKKGLIDYFPPLQTQAFLARYQGIRTGGRVDDVQVEVICADNGLRQVSLTATAVMGTEGNFLLSRSVLYDITALHKAKCELEQIQRDQEVMLDNELIGIVKLQGRRVLWVNKAMTRLYGHTTPELVGQSSRIFYKDDAQFEALGAAAYPLLKCGEPYRTQLEMRRKDGSFMWADIKGVMLSPSQELSIWFVADISDLKLYQLQIEHLAFHDCLTGLPNRTLFADRIKQALAIATRTQACLAACYVDMDGFKQLNDAYGHAAGDIVLKEVAHRLQHAMRPNDTACRLGGDEFALLITQFDEDSEYLAVLQRALTEIRKPIALDGATEVQVSVSMGVARYPTDGTDAEMLLLKADQAMYQSKHLGRNRICVFGEVNTQ